ncbi:FERM domain-containing protein [Aphelenchoides bicaudatus]|nr:FERM domain-containing protein [Aphelenchoides bicaudatus]
MPTKSNISMASTAVNDTRNTSSESKKSLLQVGSSFIHRIQSSTFMGPKHFNINIQLLDDLENVQGYFKKTSTGQDVLDFVCKELNIIEKEYFGLRYNDKHRYWVDLSSPLSKMFTTSNVALSFRVRFYPTDLNAIKEEVTRYNLFVQLQRDLSHGRLQCNQTESIKLAALILQVEQGDFDEERHLPGYVSEFKLLLRQSSRIEEKIAEHHKELRSMSSEVAMNEFLKECVSLQTYGVNPYTVTIGKNQTNVVVGASSSRIIVFVMNQCVYTIEWRYVQAIDYSGKHLKIVIKPTYFSEHLKEHPDLAPEAALSKVVGSTLFAEDLKPTKSDKKMQLKFNCPSSTFAKHLWRDLLSQQVFFHEDAAKNVKLRFFKGDLLDLNDCLQ